MGPNSGRHEMDFYLDFKNNTVRGGGSDDIGAFNWRGTYDTKLATCNLLKHYMGNHSVIYEGFADENGIWGIWKIPPFQQGGFHIWPKDKSEGNEDEEAIVEELFMMLEKKNVRII